jgi:hypothetical protein
MIIIIAWINHYIKSLDYVQEIFYCHFNHPHLFCG